jgi:hypothetical protein
VQSDTTTVTTGERSDLIRRAFSAASTAAWLASFRCSSSSCSRPYALTTRIDSSPSWTTATMSLCRWRTSWVAFLTAFLKRETKRSRNGVTATAISVKSKFSQNIRPSMPMIVRMSTKIPSVEPEAKFWMVVMSVVIVERRFPVCCLS